MCQKEKDIYEISPEAKAFFNINENTQNKLQRSP
jgi:hypothetical protein